MSDLQDRLRSVLADRYAIEREIGHGGMAQVFLAHDLKHDRRVALKVLRPELAAALGAERFLREIQIAASLTHPHILPLHDSGEAAGFLYYVMPYVEGESLRERLNREKQLPVEEALRIAREVASALSCAHSRGVIHRDIKPENILLESGEAVVADFGIARAISAAGGVKLTETGIAVGTPAYMSPEQSTGTPELDGRSDVYSLGCVLYEMLAGEPPFTGPTAQAILARQSLDPVPPLRTVRETVPEVVERAITKALAKVPADRFIAAAEFAEALVPGVAAPPISRRTVPVRPAIALGAGLAAVVGAVLLWRLWSPGGHKALDPNVVVVTPFDVLEPQLERWREGLVDLLSANLDGAGPLSAVSPTVVIHRWKGRADRDAATELGRRMGAGLAVFGRVLGTGGDSARVTASLLDVTTGRVLGGAIEVRDLAARMDRLGDSLTVALLRELNRTRAIGAVRHAGLGYSTLPALSAFLRGEQFFRRAAWDSAMVNYKRAVALDPTFAVAWRRMSGVRGCGRIGFAGDPLARDYGLRAGAWNRRLAPRESLLVAADSLFESLVDQPVDPAWRERHARLFATLEEATRRYPDDPEVWYELGDARFHLMRSGQTTLERMLETFDRAIALDSAFGPAYIHAVDLALRVRGPAAARRYLAAYLGLHQGDPNSEGLGVVDKLLASRGPWPVELERHIDTAPTYVLLAALVVIGRYPDSAETGIRLARALVASRRGGEPVFDDSLVRSWLLTRAFAVRGHLRDAYVAGGAQFPEELVRLAALGFVPPDTARGALHHWLSELPRRQLNVESFTARLGALPWWAERRDTAGLHGFVRRTDEIALAPQRNVELTLVARYGAASGRAYLALARRDTAEALRRFIALPDSICPCPFDRLVAAQLLAARDRAAEAAPLLERWRPVDFLDPTEGPWWLERARLADRLGNRERALEAYRFVAELWRAADPELQPYVEEARDGVRRLGEPRRGS